MISPLRLMMPANGNKPPYLALTSSWHDVKDELFLREYVDSDKAAEIISLVNQEKALIAKRIELFSSLKKDVAAVIENLTKAEINAHLLQKYPEEFL